MRRVTAPRALLVVGNHVVQYAAGEIWHLLDHRYGLPLSLVDRHRLGSVDLADYTHVLLVDGRYSDLLEEAVEEEAVAELRPSAPERHQRWRHFTYAVFSREFHSSATVLHHGAGGSLHGDGQESTYTCLDPDRRGRE